MLPSRSCRPTAACLSAEFRIHLLRPAEGDLLLARGRVVRPGKTLTVTELEVAVVKDGKATRCAWGSQTLVCVLPGQA
jgi:acyl-coenzyme A thioesterase PaaI-like protein